MSLSRLPRPAPLAMMRVELSCWKTSSATSSGLAAVTLRELEAGRRAPAREEALAIAAALTLDGPKLAAIACDHWHPAHPSPHTARDVVAVRGDIGGYEVKGYLFFDPATRKAVMIDSGYNPEAML